MAWIDAVEALETLIVAVDGVDAVYPAPPLSGDDAVIGTTVQMMPASSSIIDSPGGYREKTWVQRITVYALISESPARASRVLIAAKEGIDDAIDPLVYVAGDIEIDAPEWAEAFAEEFPEGSGITYMVYDGTVTCRRRYDVDPVARAA